jgi:lysozyme family protein
VSKAIDQLLTELIGREGGYVNNPADRGGATMYGITEAVARANGYDGAMNQLPIEKARAIYRAIYWERPHFDLVAARAPRIAEKLFDIGVNMGPAVAATFFQRALTALNRGASDYPDLVPDGRLGNVTLSGLDAFLRLRGRETGQTVLLHALDALQGERYIRLAETNPKQETFLYGWLANRIEDVS